jgi:hypothetical protein
MQKLKSSFSTARRRLAERAFQAAGVVSSSAGEEDAQFESAIARFRATVSQIRDVEEAMKEHIIIMGAFLETQHRLAASMHVSFQDGPLAGVSAQYVTTQQDALSDFAQLKAIYLDHVLHPTNELLRKSIPELEKLLEKRGALKLDADSYTRRANAELTKDSSSSASAKLVLKRDTAVQKMSEITQKIREHLDDLEQRRPSMLVSELSALLGIQQHQATKQSEVLSDLLPSVPHAAVTICALAHAAGGNAQVQNTPFDQGPSDDM